MSNGFQQVLDHIRSIADSEFEKGQVDRRYIPTPVGRFERACQFPLCVPVHPHACGEIQFVTLERNRGGGTSPRLWGDLNAWQLQKRFGRYIPTPVGRLWNALSRCVGWSVHPHACGEIGLILRQPTILTGTSPRLWGD